MESRGDSIRTNAHRDIRLSPADLKARADLFLSGSDPRDPLASPLYGDYTGICPLYIQVGADEILLDDARRIVERAREAGVEVNLEVFPEMQHEFQLAAGNMPEADIAVAKIGGYLRSRLGLA
jgi:acetyl esterase/lipase